MKNQFGLKKFRFLGGFRLLPSNLKEILGNFFVKFDPKLD
jgi:hypothetical protein